MDLVFSINSIEEFERVCGQILDNLYYSNCEDIDQLKANSVEEVKQHIRNILWDNQFKTQNLLESFKNRGWDEEKLNMLLGLIEQKKSQLMYSELSYQISRHGETITGFDWILKMVAGSSDLKTLRSPLLQLICSTVNGNGDQKHLAFEMCKDKLYKLIELLEICIN